MTDAELIQRAIYSIRQSGNLSLFWVEVHYLQQMQTLTLTDSGIKRVLKMNDATIYKTADQLRIRDSNISEHYPAYETNLPSSVSGGGEWGERIHVMTPVIEQSIIDRLGGDKTTILALELSPESMARSEKLIQDVAARYGWRRSGTVFVQDELGLIYFSKTVRLHVMQGKMPMP